VPTASDPKQLDSLSEQLERLAAQLEHCRRCGRLVAWREQAAREPKAAFAGQRYWARPVPGFGDPAAPVLVYGLAPAAHGANRTGRMFTGDRSGEFLYAAMWRAGLASQPTAPARGDGLELHGARVSAAVRCAPPQNKPTPAERDTCLPWSVSELELLVHVRVIVCLGAFAWDAALRLDAALASHGDLQRAVLPSPRPRFDHGAQHDGERLTLLGSYHPSQQNTFTGRLTEPMIDAVFARAKELSQAPQ
jgi:uracil-DNA glycosylase